LGEKFTKLSLPLGEISKNPLDPTPIVNRRVSLLKARPKKMNTRELGLVTINVFCRFFAYVKKEQNQEVEWDKTNNIKKLPSLKPKLKFINAIKNMLK